MERITSGAMERVHLTDRAVLAVAGPEARSFLQGLVTNDVAALIPGLGLYSALLSPQGKILFDFFLVEGDGALLIDCPLAARDALLRKLALYRLRAKVEIAPRPQLGVFAGADGQASAIAFIDPRHPALPARAIGAVAEMAPDLPGPDTYHAARLALGVPEGADFGFEKIFAMDGGLDELHAISFGKGCYVGQELTARMKHRGTARKRPYLVTAEAALPRIGTPIVIDTAEIGEIIATYGAKGFALLRLDRLAEAQGAPQAEKIPVALVRPAWLA
jgi:folate-binding protein YgfZ